MPDDRLGGKEKRLILIVAVSIKNLLMNIITYFDGGQ